MCSDRRRSPREDGFLNRERRFESCRGHLVTGHPRQVTRSFKWGSIEQDEPQCRRSAPFNVGRGHVLDRNPAMRIKSLSVFLVVVAQGCARLIVSGPPGLGPLPSVADLSPWLAILTPAPGPTERQGIATTRSHCSVESRDLWRHPMLFLAHSLVPS